MTAPPRLDEPEPVRDQLAAIAELAGIVNPLTTVQWELRDGKLVHIYRGMTLDPRPWEAQFQPGGQ
jgi:hypothetical protein